MVIYSVGTPVLSVLRFGRPTSTCLSVIVPHDTERETAPGIAISTSTSRIL